MLDWRQVKGGQQLLDDVAALKQSMDGHRVVVHGGSNLADELAELMLRVRAVIGEEGDRT